MMLRLVTNGKEETTLFNQLRINLLNSNQEKKTLATKMKMAQKLLPLNTKSYLKVTLTTTVTKRNADVLSSRRFSRRRSR